MARIFQDGHNTYGGIVRFNGGVAVKIGNTLLNADSKLALQEMVYQATRQVNVFYDLTSTDVYFVPTRLQVQGSLNRIVGPSKDLMGVYATLGNLCAMNVVTFDLGGCVCTKADAEAGGKYQPMQNSTMKMTQVALQDVQGSMSVQNFAIMERATYTAADLEYENPAVAVKC
jgi:hypothetical protein